MSFFGKKLKKLGVKDIAFIKFGVFFFTLFLVTVWPSFRNLVLGIDWYWFLMLFVIFAIPVWKKMF